MQRVIEKMIIHFVFNLKKKVKDMKDKIKSITHIQKDESMKVKSIKGKKQNNQYRLETSEDKAQRYPGHRNKHCK